METIINAASNHPLKFTAEETEGVEYGSWIFLKKMTVL